jgi:hypothetical protein
MEGEKMYFVGDLELLSLPDVRRLSDCGFETGEGLAVESLF